jgi:RNA polymerase sigma factor (sigma-70 family)
MSEVTRILNAAEAGDPQAAEQLLPLVYAELRRLAAAQMGREKPGQTLDATALVHEAYLRLLANPAREGGGDSRASPPPSRAGFANKRYFFAAAAEAMRRILVENARRKKRQKRGGGRKRVELRDDARVGEARPDEILAIDDALAKFAAEEPVAAELVKLRYFAGLSVEEAGDALGLSRAAAYRHWTYARAWVRAEMCDDS